MSLLLARERHPVVDPDIAMQNAMLVCHPRGYCGPFINQDYYDAFPDAVWHGMGDCATCGTTRKVAPELIKAMRLRSAA